MRCGVVCGIVWCSVVWCGVMSVKSDQSMVDMFSSIFRVTSDIFHFYINSCKRWNAGSSTTCSKYSVSSNDWSDCV